MTESDTTVNPPSPPGPDQPTAEILLPAGSGTATHSAVSDPLVGGPAPWEAPTDDGDAWPQRGPRRGIKVSIPTMVMLAVLLAGGGIWGGAALQRGEGTSSGSSSLSSLASLFRGARGTGTGSTSRTGLGGAFGAATAGTVTEVSGSTLYVTNSSGTLVKVTLGPTATVSRTISSSLSGLQVGDTVVVRGTTGSNGTVSATSVSATASGVSSSPAFGG
jgi:hypothetical protein